MHEPALAFLAHIVEGAEQFRDALKQQQEGADQAWPAAPGQRTGAQVESLARSQPS